MTILTLSIMGRTTVSFRVSGVMEVSAYVCVQGSLWAYWFRSWNVKLIIIFDSGRYCLFQEFVYLLAWLLLLFILLFSFCLFAFEGKKVSFGKEVEKLIIVLIHPCFKMRKIVVKRWCLLRDLFPSKNSQIVK